MTTINKTLDNIKQSAATHTAQERFVRTMQIGEWFAQGDLDIIQITKIEFDSLKGVKTQHQLAPGSTKGSRHIASNGVQVFTNKNNDALAGPVLSATARWSVTHPEHADVSLPAGYYRIDYQRDYELEERERVRD